MANRAEIVATTKERGFSFLGAVVAAILVLALTARINLYEQERYETQVRVDTVRHAALIRARLEAALNARLHLVHGLAAFVKSHPTDLLDFPAFAEAMVRTGVAGIRSLQLAPQAVVQFVYPLTGNESVLGHDLLGDPARRDAVRRTIAERLFVVAGPFPLLQGGTGLVARYPLFLSDGGGDFFWGFATVVLDVEPILNEGGLRNAPEAGYAVSLRGKDALGAKGAPFFGDAALFTDQAITLDVSLPHGNWQLAVAPAAGWPEAGPYSPYIWAAGLLLALLAATLTYMRLYAPARLRAEVARATAALQDSEEQFRSVAESATDAIVSTESGGKVVFWNKAAEQIFQFSREEALGRSINELVVPPQYREAHPNRYFVSEIDGERRLGRVSSTVAMRKDGTVFPAELTLSHWTLGGETFFTAIVRDITERKATEREQSLLKERYFQAQKMEAIGTLASGAAHEFNNILNGLLANTEKAMSELPPDSAAMPGLYEVLDAGWRAAEIVRQLLVFSEKESTREVQTNPSEAVEQMVSRLRTTLPEGVELSADVARGVGELAIDHDRFCHLVWNLCMNGLRAIVPGSGRLSISLSEQTRDDAALMAEAPPLADGEVPQNAPVRLVLGELLPGTFARLTVTDTGRGMDAETLERAFEPFFTTARVGNGSGLGLSVVLGIVQSQGGSIAVSTREGRGTAFEVYLPVAVAHPPTAMPAVVNG